MKTFIRSHPIWSFIILNYVISWLFLYPSYKIILENETITPLAFIGLIGAYGPTIAAIMVQYYIDRNQVRILLKKLIHYRTGWRILIFVMLIPVILYLVARVLSSIVMLQELNLNLLEGLRSYGFYFLVALPFGPMGEELGWRGYMLPKLLEKHSIIKSTILVGLAWGIWHLASFTFPGAAIPDFLPVNLATIGLFCLNTISLSMIYTYVHFRSGGSVLMAILLHAFFNAAANVISSLLGATDNFSILLSSYILNFVLAAILGWMLIKRRN